MFATLALAAGLALAPNQAGSLTLSNARLTYRELGPVRPDAKFLPGDIFFLAFDIEGLRMNEEGRVAYSMSMEVLDKANKVVMNAPASKSEMILPLGGTKLPGHVYAGIGPELQPGTYTCKITFSDAMAGAGAPTKTIEQKFEVLPMTFGIVAFNMTLDDRALIPCGTTGVVGQTVFANFALVGFGRDASKKPDSAVEFRVLDSAGKATTSKPTVIPMPREMAERDQFVPFTMPLPLNREGAYTIEIRAADKAGNKTATLTLPIKVLPASK